MRLCAAGWGEEQRGRGRVELVCAAGWGEESCVCGYLFSGARAPGDLPGTRDSSREEGAGERVNWQSHF